MSTNTEENWTIKKGNIIWLLMFAVLCLQLICIVQIHSIVGHLTIWDTLLLLIIRIDESPILGKWFEKQRKTFQRPFFHIIGCITVEALLFVAFTHAIEKAFCDEAISRLTLIFLGITLFNVIVKLGTIKHFRIRLLKVQNQIILHLLVPATLLILFSVNYLYSPQNSFYFSKLDPWLSMALCVFITLILVPVFFHHVPCLLCNSPDGIQIDKFKNEIETKFPRTKCLHMHVFRIHPNNTFDAIMHIAIDLENQHKDLSASSNFAEFKAVKEVQTLDEEKINSSTNYDNEWAIHQVKDLLSELRCVLQKAGARKITIQPHVINRFSINETKNNNNKTKVEKLWNVCKTIHCSENKGCCDQLN